jgi:hypothetical protein
MNTSILRKLAFKKSEIPKIALVSAGRALQS